MKNDFQTSSWFVVCKSSALKSKPISVTLLEEKAVIFRSDNSVVALKDVCPHRGVPLSLGAIDSGCIECAYHGWRFNGKGQLVSIPGRTVASSQSSKTSTTPLVDSYSAVERGGYIWLRLNDRGDSEPWLPKMQEDYPYATLVKDVRADRVSILENFLDPMHTHYIHSGIIRSKPTQLRHLCQVNISALDNGYQAIYREDKQQSGILSRLFGGHIVESIGRVIVPGIAEIEYRSKDAPELVVTIHVTPMGEGNCRLFMRAYIRPSVVPFWLKVPLLFPLQWIAFHQDKAILEQQRRNLDLYPNFKPMVVVTDIMRRSIEKTLRGEISPVDKQVEITL